MSASTCPDREPLSILIVDDNRDAVEMMALLLETYGHRTHGAADAEEALEMARRLRPDIVLLDIGLPGIDGFEVCRRLRRQEDPGARACVLAVTGWAGSANREAAVAAGFDDYLVKPVEVAAVLQALETCRSAALAASADLR
ncbi:response regulator [Ramlibacter aurantiacus]|nr:response regulator [Ramlibacter aurantiacus]